MDLIIRKHKRARRKKITVHCDGSVVLTVPFWENEKSARSFLAEKESWVLKQLEKFKPFRPKIDRRRENADYKKYKKTALELVCSRLKFFNRFYGLKFGRVSIKKQKTRWGSCSQKGNLNFNYKLALIRSELADYVIVHELCHLKEMNHSKKFWDLVGLTAPEYKKLKKELLDFPRPKI